MVTDAVSAPSVREPLSPWVRLRSVSAHPFVYRKMVGEVDAAARPGDVVQVYDKQGLFCGRGIFNPRSQIAIRFLTRDETPVDEAFWHRQLEKAVALRRQLGIDQATDAYRLVHTEGDQLSGLVVERYADCLVFEMFSLGMHQRYEQLARILQEVLGPPTALDRPGQAGERWRTYVRADSRIEKLEGFHIPGGPKQWQAERLRLIVREYDVRFRVDVQEGHKTGFFCDQRDNRQRLAALCADATVLDLCCYTGGFALHAKKSGGARAVTGVDLDEAAIAVAKENANLNQVRVDFVYADVFTYMRQMLANQRQFEVVVLDPPKLALYREEVEEARKKYYDMNYLAMQMVQPGGILLTCSCSGLVSAKMFMDAVLGAGQRAGRKLQLFDRSDAAPDHPVMMNCPESAYLKALWLRVL